MPDSTQIYTHRTDPLLVVISGPSGVGKDSIIDRLKAHGLSFHFAVTATTRPPRPDEQNGVDYFFMSNEEFARMIENGELLEHALVYNDYKGIPKAQVKDALASGKDVVLRVDVQGAATVRKIAPDALLIFVTIEDEADLVRRLKARNTETLEDQNIRIAMAPEEVRRVDEFDYVILNSEDRLEEAVETILAIIRAEHHRVHPRKVSL